MMKRISEKWIILIVLTLMFGGIGLSKMIGIWHTESQKIPAKITEGEFAGENNPEDIRGSYSLLDVSNQFDIPVDVLITAFMLPADTDPEVFKSKDLEAYYDTEYDIGNGSMKGFVALYKGMPYDLTDLLLPESAITVILMAHPEMDQASIDEIMKTIVPAEPIGIEGAETSETTETIETSEATDMVTHEADGVEADGYEEPVINGYTTFSEVIALGVPKENIEALIGGDLPNEAMAVKAYCQNNGLSFSEIKAALNQYLGIE